MVLKLAYIIRFLGLLGSSSRALASTLPVIFLKPATSAS